MYFCAPHPDAVVGLGGQVAEHINEMQRIHEEYGAIFDHLFRQHHKSSKQVRQDLNIFFLSQAVFRNPGET